VEIEMTVSNKPEYDRKKAGNLWIPDMPNPVGYGFQYDRVKRRSE
jgi:hypothetical protein